MDMFSVLFWCIAVIATVLQYIFGYFNLRITGFLITLLYNVFLILLFFNGKHITLVAAVAVLVIGNFWLFGYFVSGKNRHEKKIRGELERMKAKDLSRR
ncbi:hypothetical protein QS460_05720 [Liquorilactobacillus mali]|uniref:hypothetical protein n=1 Tax=Liquorilactobacillus mali TaxID=1618 RepID=UPI000704F19B|nr:hypothetical protein [Liquorilactobacillus mali]MDN7145422.1 hypothetical protein [Liquorilactobacillus mali]